MENSEALLRVGSRHKTMILGAKETKRLSFDVLPIKSGYHSYPKIKNFFDGIEANEKIYNTFLCVI